MFRTTWHHANRFGVLSAVNLPGTPDPVPDSALAGLSEDERAHARSLTGYRQPAFVGGRLAARAAAAQLGLGLSSVLPDAEGMPVWPGGLIGSVSHKDDLAVALVARDRGATVGVDLEDPKPARPAIGRRVLRPEEIAALAEDSERAWIGTLIRFSLKEAFYKAVFPWVRRYVGFDEALVEIGPHGDAVVRPMLSKGEGPFRVDAGYAWVQGRLVACARVSPDGPGLRPPGAHR
jgi:4'-phosphopantetheinyl transferase EntD